MSGIGYFTGSWRLIGNYLFAWLSPLHNRVNLAIEPFDDLHALPLSATANTGSHPEKFNELISQARLRCLALSLACDASHRIPPDQLPEEGRALVRAVAR